MKILNQEQLDKLSDQRLEALRKAVKNNIGFYRSTYAWINYFKKGQEFPNLKPYLLQIDKSLDSRKRHNE
jgi:selenocysteine-specific translation elongation factor